MVAKLYGFMARMSMLMDDSGIEGAIDSIGGKVANILKSILSPILGVVAALGAIYAIVVGVKMARADNAEAREEAKKKLIWVVIGVAVMVGLILVFQWLPGWLGEQGIDVKQD